MPSGDGRQTPVGGIRRARARCGAERGLRYAVGGDGTPLVLVHGLGGTIENWRALAPALARSHRVLVPDLPGHGRSVALPEARALDVFADAVFAMADAEEMRRRGLGRPLARRHGRAPGRRRCRPDAVRGVVLAAAAGIGSSTRLGRVTVTSLGAAQAGTADRALPSRLGELAPRPARRVRLVGSGRIADALEPEAAEAFLVGPAHHTNTRQAGRALLVSDPRTELDRIACPCLCLWGASDKWVRLDDGIEYARRLGAPLRTIAGCGHLLIGERPDACLARDRGLRRLALAAATGASNGITSPPASSSSRRGPPPRNSTRRATTSIAAAPLALLFPRTGLQPPVDGDPPSLAEVLGAQLRLPIPGRHAHEVRASVVARAIDREHEARHLLLGPDLAQLDVGREVADQRHDVHIRLRRSLVTNLGGKS